MNEHTRISDLLPLYISGALDREQNLAVEKHLPGCVECQADLALWKSISEEIIAGDQAVTAPHGLVERALKGMQLPSKRPASPFEHIGNLLRSQMPLVHREIWPASALVIGLGFVAALLSAQSVIIYALAPLIASACVSLIYGQDNDPAFELALSTPTSPRQILLARLVLVFGYNLALVLFAALGLLPVLAAQFSHPIVGALLLAWLGPMTFLSAAALALSLWIGAPNAIAAAYIAWLVDLLAWPLRSPASGIRLTQQALDFLSAYQTFWQSTGLLLVLSVLLFAAAIWQAGRQGQGLRSLT